MKKFIEKLIDRLLLESSNCKVYKLINPNIEDIKEFNVYKKCIEIVNQLAEEYINTSSDTSSGWISVKDSLPSDEKGYLVTLRDGEVTVAKYDKEEKMWVDTIEEYYEYPVIAWQPLPAPYKEGE